jgi:hypothetical protein
MILTSTCGKCYKIYIKTTGKIRNLRNFHADFVKASHNALLQIFPNCKITYCNFILGQNWFKHIQQHKMLMTKHLNNNLEIGKWMKCFLDLHFLHPEEVSDGFCKLMSVSPSTNSSKYYFYIYQLDFRKLYYNRQQFSPDIMDL